MTMFTIRDENFILLGKNKDRNLMNKNGNHQAKYRI